MKLTLEQVRRIAHLARLELTEEEEARYASELTAILSYVEMLKELDTAGIPETSQVTGLTNVTRTDEARELLAEPDALLNCSALPQVNHQLRIKRIL